MIFRSRHSIGKVSRGRGTFRSTGASYQAAWQRKKLLYSFLQKLVFYGAIVSAVGVFVLGIVAWQISRNLPDVDRMSTYIPYETTKIYTDDGKTVLAELHQEENRMTVPIERISPLIRASVIAMEDTDFYSHHGVNIKGMFRALIKDIIAGSFVEGGSTLTQQLARNLFLTKRKKITRKIAEMILSVQIERKYSKTEIFEMYLNQVYWGHNAYGIESASQMYFGKQAEELTLAESAMLVGLLKGPELYSPFKNIKAAKKRQRIVLGRLEKLRLITPDIAQEAYKEPIVLAERKRFRYKAPYFTSYIVQQLIRMFGEDATFTAGLKVYTTLNYEMQMQANAIVQKYIEYGKNPAGNTGIAASLNYSEAAILAIETDTGYIKVLQGGVDFKENEYNRCTQARRQPGSAFKPFVYLAALERGFSPGTQIEDGPITYNTIQGPYCPQNYTKEYLGWISLRRALEQSVNVVAIKLNQMVGPKNVVRIAHLLGIKSPLQPVLSLPLGANEVTMLELTSAYATLANNGRRIEPTGIIRIEDREGNVLFRHEVKETRVFDENLIAVLVDMMTGVVKNGTGKNANLPRPVAGKTGTTSDYKDSWFVGFIPQMVCSVWVGNDDNTPMARMTGGWVPAMMWREFMTKAIEVAQYEPRRFMPPQGLITRKVRMEEAMESNKKEEQRQIESHKSPESDERFWKGTEGEAGAVPRIETPQQSDDLIEFFKR